MFSNNCSNGSISTSCSFICAPNQSTSRPTSSLANSYHSFGPNVKLAIEVTTTSDEELRNRKYKERCNRLQKQIRELVFVNKAIHSELNECFDRLSKGSDERRFLLNKILHFHKDVQFPQEAISSRILQEALSKKQTNKYCPLSPPLSTPSAPTPDSERPTVQSSQPFCPKLPTDQSLTTASNANIQSTQSFATQTISTQSLPTIGSNKRIKLSDCQTNAKNV